jgi:hypothetical protein
MRIGNFGNKIRLFYRLSILGRLRTYSIKIARFTRTHRTTTRIACGLLAVIIVASVVQQPWASHQNSRVYGLADVADLIPAPVDSMAASLTSDKKGGFVFNDGYSLATPDVAGQSGSPKITASFGSAPSATVSVTDPKNKVDVSFAPKFAVNTPYKDKNRVVYPVLGEDAALVYSLKGAAVKEDIILFKKSTPEKTFEFKFRTASGTEPRIEPDGSIGVYGVSSTLLGNITAGTDADAKLLEKARTNGKKDQLLFRIPAPVVLENSTRKSASATASFELSGDTLKIHTTGLANARYPLSIDPTVYVETAQKFMRGNNESNVDFDPANELIQKSKTTGARINGWVDSTDANSGTWDQSVAAASGYVYRAGGRVDPTMPYVAGSQATVLATAGTTITANMPAIRPAGDLYLAFVAHKSLTAVTQTGGGWTKYGDSRELSVFGKIGAAGEPATYNFVGGSSEYVATIVRFKGFDGTSGITSAITGTVGFGSDTVANTPVFPVTATPPATDASLVVRAAGLGANTLVTPTAINPSAYGWLPGSHTQIYSGFSSSAVGVNAALVVAAMDQPPLGGASTGTTTLTDDGLIKATNGTVSIAIKAAAVSSSLSSKVEWAQLNGVSATVDSPNPGAGVCTGWCNNSLYDLRAPRRGMQMVAYNGYLYAMGGSSFATGGTDTTVAASATNTVWVAKLGANGEPQLWHPSTGTKDYWYESTNTLPALMMQFASVAYNNKLYIFGGINTAGTSLNNVYVADILPTGDIGAWSATGMQTLPTTRFGHSVQQYNDTFYLIGGNSGGTLQNTVYYSRITSTGTMGAWKPTSNFTTARASGGGAMTGLVGGYIYLAGGCSLLTSGFCGTVAADVQLASINADGTLGPWNPILTLSNQRIGYSFVAWQGGLYRIGGCDRQNTTTGVCYSTHQDVEYGSINPDGDASTVSNSVPANTGTCSGASPINCDLPTAGDGAEQGGQMTAMSVVNNGYIYVIGGCTNVAGVTDECTTAANTAAMSGNTMYASLNTSGQMTKPAACTGGTYVTNSLWCVDSTHTLNGTTGLGAAGVTVFNNRIYVIGGTTGSNWQDTIYMVPLSNSDGSLTANWTVTNFAGVGLTGTAAQARGYLYTFTRANPVDVAGNPANLYILGGCRSTAVTDDGIGCTTYYTETIKCQISAAGAVNTCSTSGQLQIDADNINTGSQGLALMAGTIYANRLYLVGGSCTGVSLFVNSTDPCANNGSTILNSAQRKETIYAKINNNNDIVDNTTGLSSGSWKFTSGLMNPVRRRAVSFGYNGYIYSLAGYSGVNSLQDLLFAKINVSTGDMGNFSSSGVVVTPRWDLRAVVSNGYVYALGGCAAGAAPQGCTSMQFQVQTFQLYNNDSGAINDFSAMGDDTFDTSTGGPTDRIGMSSTVLNGYLYAAGGCTLGDCGASVPDNTVTTANVQYIALDPEDGKPTGSWTTTTAALPAARSWGQLETAGGYLYYIAGQDGTRTAVSTVYYAQPTAGNITSWATSANPLPFATKKAGGTVWNNRLYMAGGFNSVDVAQNKVYVSPDLSAGGDIPSPGWSNNVSTSFNVPRADATLVAYANNLYIMGGFDFSTSYFTDTQYAAIGYKAGTISQTANTLFGTTTVWTSAMIGSKVLYPDGSTATVTAFTSGTQLTVDVSKTVAAGTVYTIADGNVYGWTYGSSLPFEMRGADGFAANGYMYLVGGVNNNFCYTTSYSAPISANTTIATGNLPTGLGDFYQTNVKYTGARYGASVAYSNGKFYTMGGGCGTSVITSSRHYYSTVKSQPQIAKYSRLIDTDTDVFPQKWLMNGLDNSIGASWKLKYKSMHDIDAAVNPAEDCGTSTTMSTMANYGYETNFGNVSLGVPGTYTARNGTTYSAGTISQTLFAITGSGFTTDLNGGIITYADGTRAIVTYVSTTQLTSSVSKSVTAQTYRIDGGNINCARYFYMSVSIDSSQAYGYPEDVTRGPTLSDITLLFTSDPSKRLMHGRTFTGGEQQPLDAPF